MADYKVSISKDDLKIRLSVETLSLLETSRREGLRPKHSETINIQLVDSPEGSESPDIPFKKSKKKDGDKYVCNISGCGKEFSDSSSLRKHQSVHGDRQYTCPVEGCGRKFLDNSKLRRHMLVHTVIST
jgi:uncharacterized Zn-finger protein